jgi:hypothetical protein
MEIHLVKRKKSFVAENVNGPIVYPIKPDPWFPLRCARTPHILCTSSLEVPQLKLPSIWSHGWKSTGFTI